MYRIKITRVRRACYAVTTTGPMGDFECVVIDGDRAEAKEIAALLNSIYN